MELLIFKVNDVLFGVNVDYVSEIINCTTITPVPRSRKTVKGIIHERDMLLTVIDVRKIMFEEDTVDIKGKQLIITKKGNEFIALLIENLCGIKVIDEKDILDGKFNCKASRGHIKTEYGMVNIIDYDEFYNLL